MTKSFDDMRDMFAAHALAAIIIRDGTPCAPKAQVKAAFDYAELMLAALREAMLESD